MGKMISVSTPFRAMQSNPRASLNVNRGQKSGVWLSVSETKHVVEPPYGKHALALSGVDTVFKLLNLVRSA